MCPSKILYFYDILWILHQQFLDEIFRHGARQAEVVLIKLIFHGNDVSQSLFISVALEW